MTELDNNRIERRLTNPPNWAFMFGAFAFVAPIAVATTGLVGPFVLKWRHGVSLSEFRDGFVVNGVVFALAMAAFLIWILSRRWLLIQTGRSQKLLALLCWLLTLLGYGICLMMFY